MGDLRKVESYYENYDEWQRLERHKIEFEITKRYLDRYIPEKSRVLDVGGGPGRYSIYLASKGYRVVLLDLTRKHIEIAREKAALNGVELGGYVHGNALELENYNLGLFDAVLLMGPLYHLTDLEDRKKSVRNALSLLNPGGILVASFISAYAPFVDIIKNRPEELKDSDEVLKYLENGVNSNEEGFTTAYFTMPQEARSFMDRFGLQELAFAGIEGLTAVVEQRINALPQREFEQYLEATYRLSQDPHTFGSCEHYLYIGRKEE